MRYEHIDKKFPLFYKILDEAEKLFGKGDETYDLFDIIYDEVKSPHVFYLYPLSGKRIMIRITKNAEIYPDQTYFQISHEVIHTLSPIINIEENRVLTEETTILEEGLASYFSYYYMKKNFHSYYLKLKDPNYQEEPGYKNARELVKGLLSNIDGITEDYDIKDDNIIKKVREKQQIISYLKIKDFSNIDSNLTKEFFEEHGLLKLFDKFNPSKV